MAQAKAERSGPKMAAREQEMVAAVQENRAKVVLAEAECPRPFPTPSVSGNWG